MDCFKHCHHQIGDKGYYIVKETDTVLKGMSPRQHYTPDVIQKMTNENNITIIGTRKDGFVIAKKESNKSSEASNGPVVENGTEAYAGAESRIVDNNVDDNDGDDESEDDEDDNDGSDEDKNNSANNASHSSPAINRNRNRKRAFLKSGKSLKKLRGRLPKKKLKMPERTINPGDKVPIEIFYTFSSCRVMWQVNVLLLTLCNVAC